MKIFVTMLKNNIQHIGEHEGYTYDELILEETSGKRLYFAAIKNGEYMTTLIKVMKMQDGKIFITFEEIKHEIGTYEISY